ncbi:MAG: cytochrome c biogenesis protein ResB [Dehalococcoidia bacterium]
MATARPAAISRGPAPDALLPVWRVLTSVRFAVVYIATLAFFGLLGVLIPQVPEVMRGNDAAISVWLDTKRDTFGPLTDPMHNLGFFEIYQARWFIFALGFLVINVTICTFNRWSPTFRNVFRPPVRVPDTFFERAHNRTTLAPVSVDTAEATLHRLRFRTRTGVDEGGTYVFADRYPWAQLATFISHLALILFIAGGLVTQLTGFSRDIFLGEGTTMPVFVVADPGQLQVRVDDAVGRYGEQGNPLDFRTFLTIYRNGEAVKSGVTTVNDPLKYGGYRFHQVGYFPLGAALRIRDLSTGNTVVRETFPLQETVAAPSVTLTDASGETLLSDVIAPTDFLTSGSGSIVDLPGAGRVIWIGITAKDDDAWQLVAYDPQAGGAGSQIRVDEGGTAELEGLRIRFDDVVSLPSAVGIGVPGRGDAPLLAQLTHDAGGAPVLLVVGEGRPALALGEGAPEQLSGYEYTFEGQREFAGISVKRDHGAWFIWAATGMLVGGLALTFYVPRRRLWLKLTPEATHVAGLAEKSGGFEKDVRILANRLGVPEPPELQQEEPS